MTAFVRLAISWWMEAPAAHDSPERLIWATAAYDKYQKCELKAALHLLVSRWEYLLLRGVRSCLRSWHNRGLGVHGY